MEYHYLGTYERRRELGGQGKHSKTDIKGHVHSGSEVGGFIFSRELGDLGQFSWALEQISSSEFSLNKTNIDNIIGHAQFHLMARAGLCLSN